MTTKALVLGGGGVTGIAWELGVIAGLAEHGVDVRSADLDLDLMIEIFTLMTDESTSPDERRAKVGARALATDTVAESLRRGVIVSRLPSHE